MKPHYFILSLLSIFFFSCDKDTEILYPDPFYPDQEQFRTSLFIEVTNANGGPVADAIIRIGSNKYESDVSGLLYVKDALVAASTYLTVEKDGYFHASRRFYPTEGDAHYIKIIMLSDAKNASFSSGAGGLVNVDGGVTFSFPKDGYEYENGEPYNGIVEVAAKTISADDPDLSYMMPGDLTGINATGNSGSLGSFGMVAVELASSEGRLLRLKEGIQVQMEMTLPSANAAVAPSTIPMWYFDEEEGVWKEEGVATLTGNVYTALVSHFSYWNYDDWFPAIKWGAAFEYNNNEPATQVEVCITIVSLNARKCAYTNAEGFVCGLVAANELLLMEVYSTCGQVIYTEEIGPFSDSTMMGPITLNYGGLLVTNVSGLAVTCDNAPVTNGYAKIQFGGYRRYTTLDETTGAFNVTLNSCNQGVVKIDLVDYEHNKVSFPMDINYAPVIDAGTIQVCDANQEFIDLEVVGFPEHFLFNFPSFNKHPGEPTHIYQLDSIDLNNNFYIVFNGEGEGTFVPFFVDVKVTLPNGDILYAHQGNLSVTITHYGEVGDYVTGTLSGTWFPDPGGSGGTDEHPLVGTFSVFRED